MASKKYLVISDLRGGRNGSDPPLALPDTQAVEVLNADFYDSTLGRKRNGSIMLSTSSFSYDTPSGYVSSLCRGASAVGDELFLVDGDATPLIAHKGAYNTTNAWTTMRYGDQISANPEAVASVAFNNRTYLAYNSTVDRLHYWKTSGGSDTIHRVGIPVPAAAPTAADVGGGTQYPNTRYYKVAWTIVAGSTVENRSELSAKVTFTPGTTAGPVRVTKPATPSGEDVTHWEVYASSDDANYHLLASTAIATATYDDSANPAAYAGAAPPRVGSNVPPGSWKYIATDGNRLIGTGNWEGGNQSRVWFTAVYGASDVGDSERVPTANYIDLDAYGHDDNTGIVGTFMGNTVVFKNRQIWRLVPTGESDAPYRAVCLTRAIGCIAPKSICEGEDETGNPAIYFMSHRGPYRLGATGLEYCGRDVEDIITAMNQRATVVSHAVWHPGRHQVWFWVSQDSDNYPSVIVVLDTHLCRRGESGVRGGWSKFTGAIATARCSINWNRTSITYGSKVNTQPYVGSSVTTMLVLRCDADATTTDDGAAFQAYVKTKPYALGGLGFNCSIGQSHLSAKASTGAEITQTIDRDYGVETRTSTCLLTALGNETRVQRQFEGSDMAGAGVVQFKLGDAAALSQTWTLDALMLPYSQQEER